ATRRSGTGIAHAPSSSEPAKRGNTGNGNGSHGPQRRIRLDFRDVDIDNVLKFFSMAAGKTLIKDPSLSGPVTMLLPQPVTLEEGYRVLDAVLSTKGYTLERDPMLIRVVPVRRFGGFGGGGFGGGGFGADGGFGGDGG